MTRDNPRTRIREFLLAAFTHDELARLVDGLDSAGKLLRHLPDHRHASAEAYCDAVVALLDRHGWLTSKEFRAGLRGAREHRAAEFEPILDDLVRSDKAAKADRLAGPFGTWALGQWRPLATLFLVPIVVGVGVWWFMPANKFIELHPTEVNAAGSSALYAVYAGQATFAGLALMYFASWSEPGTSENFGDSPLRTNFNQNIRLEKLHSNVLTAIGEDPDSDAPVAVMYQDAVEATQQMRYTWIGLWLSWMSMYTVMFALSLAAASFPGRYKAFCLLVAFFNNGATAALLVGFWILAFSALRQERALKTPAKRPHASELGIVAVAPILLFLVAHLVASDNIYHDIALRLASGFVAAVALSLYVGRLDSGFIGVRFRFISLLYFYAAIQPSWAAIHMSLASGGGKEIADVLELMLFLYAWLAKFLLFALFAWIYHTGRLEFYFLRIRTLYRRIPDQWNRLTDSA